MLENNLSKTPHKTQSIVSQWYQKASKEILRNKYVYLMALPVILYYLIFQYGPMYGTIIAFKQYDIVKGVWGSPWVGFKYFIEFFESFYFERTLRNTLLISLYELLWGFPAPIILALLLNELRHNKFKRVVQTITYLPHFVSTVVICGMIFDFVSRNGFITEIFVFLGGERTNLLSQPQYFRTIFISSGIWQGVGWGTIIYLSALSGIDMEQYEAAMIDGAGRLKQLIHITLPGLMPTIVILLILRIGQVMSVGFEKIILLYNPNTYETADVISSYVYRKGLGEAFQFSFTAAVGLFQSVINFTLVISANWISRKVNETSLW